MYMYIYIYIYMYTHTYITKYTTISLFLHLTTNAR